MDDTIIPTTTTEEVIPTTPVEETPAETTPMAEEMPVVTEEVVAEATI